jgi:hypothetical protein
MPKTIKGDELNDIIIDEEFRDLLPVMNDESEYKQLKKNIEIDGCREPIAVWRNSDGDVLIDGHHRLSICKELGYPIQVVEPPLSFDDRAGVFRWMIENQRGRRNMTPKQMSLLRGKWYNETKKEKSPGRPKATKPRKNKHEKPAQSDPVKSAGETADIVAEETGVSRATVKRDGKRAEMLDKIKVTEIVKGYKSGKFKISDKSLAKLGKLSKPEQTKVLARVTAGKTEWNKYLDPKSGRVKQSNSLDTKKIDDLSGKLIRAVDDANRVKPSIEHKGCISTLRAFAVHWDNWKKEGVK